MWLSNPSPAPMEEPAGAVGQVTVGGCPAGVYVGGERRNVPLFSPGGYHWRPAAGETVLIIKTGAEGAPCLVGREDDGGERSLRPGEIWVSATPEAGLLLRPDGTIHLYGVIVHNGTVVSAPEPEEPEEGDGSGVAGDGGEGGTTA